MITLRRPSNAVRSRISNGRRGSLPPNHQFALADPVAAKKFMLAMGSLEKAQAVPRAVQRESL